MTLRCRKLKTEIIHKRVIINILAVEAPTMSRKQPPPKEWTQIPTSDPLIFGKNPQAEAPQQRQNRSSRSDIICIFQKYLSSQQKDEVFENLINHLYVNHFNLNGVWKHLNDKYIVDENKPQESKEN